MKAFLLAILILLGWDGLGAQQDYTVACIAFYNLENLFDTLDSPDTDDAEFTPKGTNLYTSKVYLDKLQKLSRVIHEIGLEYTPHGAAVIGVSEVENRKVLEDLIREPLLVERNYRILHQDSKDPRGVDVALLYQPKYFSPDSVFYHSLITGGSGPDLRYSRDILFAKGRLLGEPILFSVNHWPSRRGGAQTTAHLRNEAAFFNRQTLDKWQAHGIDKAIVMGDLNDDPVNDSVRKYLNAKGRQDGLQYDEMFNPMAAFYKKGFGTTAYQDAWSLFDQIIMSAGFILSKKGFRYYKAGIFNASYLTQQSGNFKGYPLRAYVNGMYCGGFSDHFPVYVLLVMEK